MSKITVAALVGVVVLAAVIVEIAASSANGTPEGSILAVSPNGSTRRAEPVLVPPCKVPDTSAPTSAGITLTGACLGNLPVSFRCVEDDEILYLSTRQPLEQSGALYLTIVIGDYAGAGSYPEALAYAQRTGPAETPRWANREFPLEVRRGRSVRLGPVTLSPEPGTPATGDLVVSGDARCSS